MINLNIIVALKSTFINPIHYIIRNRSMRSMLVINRSTTYSVHASKVDRDQIP